MSKINFLINEGIWETIPKIIKASKHTDVVVAYLGTDGSKLLPLKKGDRLVVDKQVQQIHTKSRNSLNAGFRFLAEGIYMQRL